MPGTWYTINCSAAVTVTQLIEGETVELAVLDKSGTTTFRPSVSSITIETEGKYHVLPTKAPAAPCGGGNLTDKQKAELVEPVLELLMEEVQLTPAGTREDNYTSHGFGCVVARDGRITQLDIACRASGAAEPETPVYAKVWRGGGELLACSTNAQTHAAGTTLSYSFAPFEVRAGDELRVTYHTEAGLDSTTYLPECQACQRVVALEEGETGGMLNAAGGYANAGWTAKYAWHMQVASFAAAEHEHGEYAAARHEHEEYALAANVPAAQFTENEARNLRNISTNLNFYDDRSGFILDGGRQTSYIQVGAGGMAIHQMGECMAEFWGDSVELGNEKRALNLKGSAVTVNGIDLGAHLADSTGGLPIAADKTDTTAPETSGVGSIAVGYKSSALEGSTVVGHGASADMSSTALGKNALANGFTSTAVGGATSATKSYATAVGHGAEATGRNTTSVGYCAMTKEDNSTAVGDHAKVSYAYNGIALGHYATVNADSSTAVGCDTYVYDTGVTVISNYEGKEAQYQTLLYLVAANSPLANTYEGGAASLGYVVKDNSGNILECGTRKLSELLTNNTAFAPASMDLDAPAPTPFMPTGITDPIEIHEEVTEEHTNQTTQQ